MRPLKKCSCAMLAEFLNALWPACAFAFALMLVVWWLSLRIENLGIVDIAWAGGFAPIAVFYAAIAHGDPLRRWVMASMAGLWSLRLAGYVGLRVLGQHPREDGRYQQLRAEWREHLKSKS